MEMNNNKAAPLLPLNIFWKRDDDYILKHVVAHEHVPLMTVEPSAVQR